MTERRPLTIAGDVFIDVDIDCESRRVDDHTGVPVLERSHSKIALGGAGAVLDMARTLAGAAVNSALLDSRGTKTRLTLRGRPLFRFDEESRCDIEREAERRILEAVPRDGYVLVADYGKGTVTHGLFPALVRRSYRAIVDPKPGILRKNLAWYCGAWAIMPSQRELPCADPAEARGLVRLLLAHYPVACLKLGAAGLVWGTRSGNKYYVRHLPAEIDAPIDTRGAGDQVLAAFGVACWEGATLPEAFAWANHLAGQKCLLRGTTPAEPRRPLRVCKAAPQGNDRP